ncbi:MAG TPA: phosphate ABC transporter permease subunit PstC, partial [Longimicrobiales bacterium]|nr:phosphate ABC transporter permease subunit PstC [Longimicrobiales bacterium]
MTPAGQVTEARPLTTNGRGNSRGVGEKLIGGVLFVCAALSTLVTVGIVVVLVSETIVFFQEVPVLEFLTGTEWTPLYADKNFGVLPLLSGSVLIALGSSIISLPIGLLTAIYLSEFASEKVRGVLKPALEILAGIPTVVYGYFALTFITPVIQYFVPSTGTFNALSASIVVGIMIIPTIASLSEDAIRAVPLSLRAGAHGLGATKMEVSTRVVVPAALSGIIASFILGISRAIGETMAVTIAAGALPQITANPFEAVQTMTAYIVAVSLGDTPVGT